MYLVMDTEATVNAERLHDQTGMTPKEFEADQTKKGRSGIPWIYYDLRCLTGLSIGPHIKPIAFEIRQEEAGDMAIARDFWPRYLKKRPVLVTWGGRFFDLPLLERDGVADGLDLSCWLRPPGTKSWEDPRNRFSDDHIDLCDYVSNNGGTIKPPMSAYAESIGVPGKLGVDGSDVGDMYAEGRDDEVAAYCATDVATLASVFYRVSRTWDAPDEPPQSFDAKVATAIAQLGDAHRDALERWMNRLAELNPD